MLLLLLLNFCHYCFMLFILSLALALSTFIQFCAHFVVIRFVWLFLRIWFLSVASVFIMLHFFSAFNVGVVVVLCVYVCSYSTLHFVWMHMLSMCVTVSVILFSFRCSFSLNLAFNLYHRDSDREQRTSEKARVDPHLHWKRNCIVDISNNDWTMKLNYQRFVSEYTFTRPIYDIHMNISPIIDIHTLPIDPLQLWTPIPSKLGHFISVELRKIEREHELRLRMEPKAREKIERRRFWSSNWELH